MKACLIIALGLILTACASSSPRIDPARLNELRPGQTTAAEVIRRFGRPSVLSNNPDGTQSAMYLHSDAPDGTLVPLFSPGPMDSVTLSFDARGVLTGYKVSQAREVASAQGQADRSPTTQDHASQGQTGGHPKGGAAKSTTGSGSRWSFPGILIPSETKENR